MILDLLERRQPAGCVLQAGDPPTDDVRTRPFYRSLLEVRVELSRGKAGEGSLVFTTRRKPDGTWEVQDAGVFDEWTPVRVLATFGPTDKVEVMAGYVREVKVDHPENPGDARVTVTLQDESLRADRVHRRQTWGAPDRTSDQAILDTVFARNRLSRGGGEAGMTGIEVNQDGTDAALLRARAEANGYDLLYEGRQVYFGPPRIAPPTQPVIRVAAGVATNCRSFSAHVDGRKPDVVTVEYVREGRRQPEQVTVEPNLPRMGARTASSESLGEHSFLMRGEAGADEATLRRRAQAKANELALNVRAEGELDGTAYGAVLQVGCTVRVDGVGERYSGTYLVDTVVHVFDGEGYRQRFTLLRNGVGDDGGKLREALVSAAASLAGRTM